jgi:TIR domain
MPNVFLSYSRTDAPMVDRIARDLTRNGVDLWMDRQNLVAGQEWLPQINRAISSADFMVVFFSKFSLRSKPVVYEYEKAFEAVGRLVRSVAEKRFYQIPRYDFDLKSYCASGDVRKIS